ncbi:hypothetical protein PENSPDRAFT_687287 [Peniophora sp. CONT]|nr:hypothetical protein PENSPDRAFT_687287 [Peniophora sp. CONT]
MSSLQPMKRASTSSSVVMRASPGKGTTPRNFDTGSIDVGTSLRKPPGSSGASVLAFPTEEGGGMATMTGYRSGSRMDGMRNGSQNRSDDEGTSTKGRIRIDLHDVPNVPQYPLMTLTYVGYSTTVTQNNFTVKISWKFGSP